jgi:nicotinamide-nucleotide amidase
VKAEIIAVGSELLTPDRIDTNSLFLTAELNKIGVEVIRKTVVGDARPEIRDAFARALDRAELVISSGGLGPTEDDQTRDAIAEFLGRRLALNPEVLGKIEERFRRFNRKMAEVNKRQALVPEGATVLENTRGTAPGLWIEAGDRVVVLLPGPPDELKAIFVKQVAERVARRASGSVQIVQEMRVTGLTESDLEQRIKDIYLAYEDIHTTILASPGEIQIHLRTWTREPVASRKAVNELAERVSAALGDNVFTHRSQSLEEVVAEMMLTNGATISTAESCTGGLLAERLTRIPGSSNYFLGGVVSYSNELKTAWAKVPAEIIAAKGAVSSEVATALAEGIRRETGSTLGVGITGVAGPAGGSAEKPVGLVHIALSVNGAPRERAAHFPGDRERVRWQASQVALDMVRRHFLEAARKREPS